MELRHLRYFVAVAEELHFGRAASRLHMAQPPLSRQIRDLEEEARVRLFDRDRRGVRLTAAGEVFLKEVRHTLHHVDRAVTAARRVDRGELGTLRVGYVSSVVYSALPEVVRVFRARRSNVEVQLCEMSPAEQLDELLAERLDVGFARGPLSEPSIEIAIVFDEPLVVALPFEHALARKRLVGLPMLANEPFLLTARSRGPEFHDHVVALCRNAGFSPRVVQEGSHFDVLSLVAAGIGLAIVPASLSEIRRGDVVYRSIREKPRTQLVMAWRKHVTSPVVREFVEHARHLRIRPRRGRTDDR